MSNSTVATETNDSVGALIRAAHGGSQDALGSLLERHRDYLLLVANAELDAELRAKGGASDLVQETFLDAQRGFPRFYGGSRKELLGWLREILRNNLNDFGRRYRTGRRAVRQERSLRVEDLGSEQEAEWLRWTRSPEERLIASERERALCAAIEQLPRDYRQVVRLRHVEGHSWSETAACMNRSINSVQKLWVRALKQLRQQLDDQ